VFFKKHHIFLQVIFVFGHVFQNLFLVLSRVKYFELDFFLFLCCIDLTDRGLDDGLKFAFNKELLINWPEQLRLIFFIEVWPYFLNGLGHFLNDVLQISRFLSVVIGLSANFLNLFLVLLNFILKAFVLLCDFWELFLDRNNIFWGFVFLSIDKVDLMLKASHQVIVD